MEQLGKWISNGTKKPFYTRRAFNINGLVKKATIKVTGLGQFILHMNGEKVGDHELDPGWTNYDKYIQFVIFDVTKYLKDGMNIIGAEVGNGWFIMDEEHYSFQLPPFMPPNPNPYKAFGKALVYSFYMDIEYQDGTKEVIISDEQSKVQAHPVIMSNVFGSETIDGRLNEQGWSDAFYDDSQWKTAQVTDEPPSGQYMEQYQPAIKIVDSYEASCISNIGGRRIYDLGQNMSGILAFEAYGNEGDEVRLYPAEKLDDQGDVDQFAKGWAMIDSCITYIIAKDEQWEPVRMKFTYFAGRYIAVEGAEIRGLIGHAITSAHEKHGTFRCDDVRYEKIYDLVEKAVEANMLSVHTDCPTIERFAWQEPNHLMAPSIMYMKNGRRLWEKFLQDMRMDQHTEEDFFYDYEGNKFSFGDGLMPSQSPCYIPNVLPVPGMGSFYDIIPWGSTCILGPYWHYQFYGDIKIIEDNYDSGMRYLSYLQKKINADGFINHGLGDWGNPSQILARENIETAFLYANTTVLKGFAELLGHTNDIEMLQEMASRIKDNYNAKLLVKHPEQDFYCYKVWHSEGEFQLTQACQALPLYWGLVPDEYEEDIAKALKYTLEKAGTFICGEISLPYVIQCASKYEMNDLICRYILKEQHPSYYAFILAGETTLGEYWEDNPRSHCHDMMGHIIEWYYNGIAGIIPRKPGFKEVSIRPYLPVTMSEFECSYESVNGLIRVMVEDRITGIYLNVQVPDETACRIEIDRLSVRGKEVIVALEKTEIVA